MSEIISPTSGLNAILGAALVPFGQCRHRTVSFCYFGVEAELEGGLAAGPLLLPGNPGTLAAS